MIIDPNDSNECITFDKLPSTATDLHVPIQHHHIIDSLNQARPSVPRGMGL
jgi:hypothetical protein